VSSPPPEWSSWQGLKKSRAVHVFDESAGSGKKEPGQPDELQLVVDGRRTGRQLSEFIYAVYQIFFRVTGGCRRQDLFLS